MVMTTSFSRTAPTTPIPITTTIALFPTSPSLRTSSGLTCPTSSSYYLCSWAEILRLFRLSSRSLSTPGRRGRQLDLTKEVALYRLQTLADIDYRLRDLGLTLIDELGQEFVTCTAHDDRFKERRLRTFKKGRLEKHSHPFLLPII